MRRVQVKHDANEIIEGETVILTLADRAILTDKGDLDEKDDELENVLKVRCMWPAAAPGHCDVMWQSGGSLRVI